MDHDLNHHLESAGVPPVVKLAVCWALMAVSMLVETHVRIPGIVMDILQGGAWLAVIVTTVITVHTWYKKSSTPEKGKNDGPGTN